MAKSYLQGLQVLWSLNVRERTVITKNICTMAFVLRKQSLSYSKYSKIKEVLLSASSSATNTCGSSRSLSNHSRFTDDTANNMAEPQGPEEGLDDTLNDVGDEHGTYHRQPRYPGHRPTSMFQKVLLTVGSAGMSLYDPNRGDMIATLGDVTAQPALKYIKQKMEQDPVGRQILEEQPTITNETVSIDYLGSLPDNTFGKEYWRFLTNHGFDPDSRLPVHYVDDPELVYVMLRYRQCHDMFHAVLGMKPNILGEVAVKWVEAIQTGLPMCALGAFFGPLRLGPVHRQKYIATYLPWAVRNGRQAKFLMSVYFEKNWERDLQEFREELNIEPPPEIPYPKASKT